MKMDKKQFTIKFLTEKLQKVTGKKVVLKENDDSVTLMDYLKNCLIQTWKYCMQHRGDKTEYQRFWHDNKKQIVSGVKKYYNFSDENLNSVADVFKKYFDLTWENCIQSKGNKEGFDKMFGNIYGKFFHEIQSLSESEVENKNLNNGDKW